MHVIKAILLSLLFFAPLFCAQEQVSKQQTPISDDDLEKLIDDLQEERGRSKNVRASEALIKEGQSAFLALIKHLDDQRSASPRVFGMSVVTRDRRTGAVIPYSPTVGEVCFDIVHMQIEGSWAKGDRRYYTLDQGMLGEWYQSRKERPLHELRLEVAAESLRRAVAAHADHVTLDFLKQNLAEVREEEDLKTYEQVVEDLQQDRPELKQQKAATTLRQAGKSAFPAMITHLNDERKAGAGVNKGGASYSVCDVCFEILQDQIEVKLADSQEERRYRVLTRRNIADWIRERSGQSLKQMRIDAAEQALKTAPHQTNDPRVLNRLSEIVKITRAAKD